MSAAAKVMRNGQVTMPQAVRDALGVEEGDEVVFRVQGNRVILTRTPDFLALAGTVHVAASKVNAPWHDVIRTTRALRASRRR